MTGQRHNASGFTRSRGIGAAVGMICILAFACRTEAQVLLGVEFENQAVVEFEPVVLTVTIRNDGETPLVFSDYYRNAELEILVRSHEQSLLQADKVAVERDLVIMPGNETRELIELSSIYSLKETGGYRIAAQVRYDDKAFRSRQRILDVVRGIDILKRTRNIPGYEDFRLTYELRYWRRNGSEYLFMVVKDKERRLSYGTFQLGRIVRFFKPEIRFDGKGFVTVVHQSGRMRFTRSIFEPGRNGIRFVEQTHHLESGDPYPRTAVRWKPDPAAQP